MCGVTEPGLTKTWPRSTPSRSTPHSPHSLTHSQHLDNDHLEHAILDVFEQEPLPENDAYWSHDKITVLPHISAPTHFESAGDIVAKNIREYRLNGQLPVYIDWNKGY